MADPLRPEWVFANLNSARLFHLLRYVDVAARDMDWPAPEGRLSKAVCRDWLQQRREGWWEAMRTRKQNTLKPICQDMTAAEINDWLASLPPQRNGLMAEDGVFE